MEVASYIFARVGENVITEMFYTGEVRTPVGVLESGTVAVPSPSYASQWTTMTLGVVNTNNRYSDVEGWQQSGVSKF